MQICFFGDSIEHNLKPLTLTRPADSLRVGVFTIAEKWGFLLENVHICRLVPSYLQNVYPSPDIKTNEKCIWVNNRFLPDEHIKTDIEKLEPGRGLTYEHQTVAVCLSGEESKRIYDSGHFVLDEITLVETQHGSILNNVWDIFMMNASQIENDISLAKLKKRIPEQTNGIHFIGDDLYIAKSAQIEPGCILDSRNGPIVIADNSTIMAGTMIKGPVALCEHATLKMGAKVYDSTTIGPHSKVGGEIHNVVFQGYCNKAHDGFLGNSAIGEWCNFGADTNNSNLKNNYSTVRLYNWNTRKEIETGLQFCGLIMGDHSKTAINTKLNTGTVCGVSSNIFMSEFPPKFIPSFSWLGDEGVTSYKLDKAIETMRIMMKRRNIEMSPAYENMIRFISKEDL